MRNIHEAIEQKEQQIRSYKEHISALEHQIVKLRAAAEVLAEDEKRGPVAAPVKQANGHADDSIVIAAESLYRAATMANGATPNRKPLP